MKMQFVFILVIIKILCIFTQDVFALDMPSGDALFFDGNTKVVLPQITFGGPFTLEVWVKANFSETPGPLVYFGNTDESGGAEDQVELGFAAGGELYLELGVTDSKAFYDQLPTTQPALDNVKSHLTTNINVSPLVRRVAWSLDSSLSNEWFLLNIRATPNGVISYFINRVLVGQTSALDIGVLPAYISRSRATFGANPSSFFVGAIQFVSLWNRAVPTKDILDGSTTKLNAGGVVGRWDFSNVIGNVVLNQAADDIAALNKATTKVQAQLDILRDQLEAAQQLLDDATDSDDIVDLRNNVILLQQEINDVITYVPGAVPNSVSPSRSGPPPQAFTSNVNGIPSILNFHEKSTNTLSELAYVASQTQTDDDLYLKLALDSQNKLPFRSKNIHTTTILQNSFPVPPTEVKNSASPDERLDGTIVGGGATVGGRKRADWGTDWSNWRTICQISKKYDMQCAWNNDPHYSIQPVNGSWAAKRFDYHSPNCHYILKHGEFTNIQELSERCGSSAGCISKVGAFVGGRYVVIFSKTGTITVNYEPIQMPFDVDVGIRIERKNNAPTLIVQGQYELSFTGSAKLLFTSEQYFEADNRSVCIYKGKDYEIGPRTFNSAWDLQPNECFMNEDTWEPPTTQCPACQNGGVPRFTLQNGCYCQCQTGWRGASCETYYCDACVHGKCTGPNQCVCDEDPYNIFGCSDCSCHCSKSMCYNGGTPAFDSAGNCKCNCTEAYTGSLCQSRRCKRGENGLECSGQGQCNNGTCVCIDGVSFGETCNGSCAALSCPSSGGKVCGGHGKCECGHCVCNNGFTGDACSVPVCTNLTGTPNSEGCGTYGTCDGNGESPVCVCNPGFSGPYCQTVTCTPGCHPDYGTCTAANPPYCRCLTGFVGQTCSDYSCAHLNNCNDGKGECILQGLNVKCNCKIYWKGDKCEIPKCLNDCSKQGVCTDHPTQPYCACNAPWIGTDCSTLPDCVVDLAGDDWSSPEWEARATSICSNTSFIHPELRESCLFDARVMDNYEIIYNEAQQTYDECKLREASSDLSFCGGQCPNFCNFNGLCRTANQTSKCECDPGFYGADCSIQPNKRTYIFKYGDRAESEITQVSLPAAPSTFLKIDATGSHTTNEVANGVVVFLYQDYRPKYGQCKPYNDLYLVILIDQARSSCSTQGINALNFALTFNASIPVPKINGTKCSPVTNGRTVTLKCDWGLTDNAAVLVGPLAQNVSWAINMDLLSPDPCYKTVYYASEQLSGKTDIVPIPITQATNVQILSEVRNSKCGVINSCSACMAADGCGWCPDLGYCMEGTPSGPTFGTCSVWRYTSDPTVSRIVKVEGFSDPVYPSLSSAYLVDGSNLTTYVYAIFPDPLQLRLDVQVMVECSSRMERYVTYLKSGDTAADLYNKIAANNSATTAKVWSFTDKPRTPYGDPIWDTQYTKPSASKGFVQSIQDLVIGKGGDEPNAQLEVLTAAAYDALRADPSNHRVAVVITTSSFHQAGDFTSGGRANDYNSVYHPNEDYPSPTILRQKLLESNLVPVFVVVGTDTTIQAKYRALINSWGFGAVTFATTESQITAAVLEGISQVFTSAKLFSSESTYVKRIYPAADNTPYTSIQPNKRVRWAVTLDRSALKRVVTYDHTTTLTVPGFGSAVVQLTRSDVPTGISVTTQTPVNTELPFILNGDNIYGTRDLQFVIKSIPQSGTLLQADGTRAVIKPGDTVNSQDRSVIYKPPLNESCLYPGEEPGDYCGGKRSTDCKTICPFTSFTYEVRDKCAATSAEVTITIDVRPTVVNKRPKAFMTTQPNPPLDIRSSIELTGTDGDGDQLTAIITSLPNRGFLEDLNGNITTVPHIVANNRTVWYTPPFRKIGTVSNLAYILNDGHKTWQAGDSNQLSVTMEILNTNHAPTIQALAPRAGTRSAVPNAISAVLGILDQDPQDFARNLITVMMTSFPRPEDGTLSLSPNVDTYLQFAVNQSNPNVPLTTVQSNRRSIHNIYFHPKPYVWGTFVFSYQGYDLMEYTPIADLTFVIAWANTPPVNNAPDMVQTILDNQVATFTLNGVDPEGKAVHYQITSLTYGLQPGDQLVAGGKDVTTFGTSFSASQIVFKPATGNTLNRRVDVSYRIFDEEGLSGSEQYFFVFINHVNLAPIVGVSQSSYAMVDTKFIINSNVLQIYDMDSVKAPLSVTFILTGPGSIDFSSRVCPNSVKTGNTIKVSCGNDMLANATTTGAFVYTQVVGQTLTANITIIVNDNGYYGFESTPKESSASFILIPYRGGAASSAGYTAGAVGAGAAAAVGLAAMYHFLKTKKIFTDESDPFAGMGDVDSATDVVLENPLYQQPRGGGN